MRRLRPLVPDCPGAEMLIRRLVEVFAPAQPPLDRLVVADARQAAQLGMTGSPTLLVDGVDPFAAPGTNAPWSAVDQRRWRSARSSSIRAGSCARRWQWRRTRPRFVKED